MSKIKERKLYGLVYGTLEKSLTQRVSSLLRGRELRQRTNKHDDTTPND